MGFYGVSLNLTGTTEGRYSWLAQLRLPAKRFIVKEIKFTSILGLSWLIYVKDTNEIIINAASQWCF